MRDGASAPVSARTGELTLARYSRAFFIPRGRTPESDAPARPAVGKFPYLHRTQKQVRRDEQSQRIRRELGR